MKQWCGADDTLDHTQRFMCCGFAVVHLPTFQGQEMEAVLNAAAVVIESVVQLILCSLCSVTCVYTNMHMKTKTTNLPCLG